MRPEARPGTRFHADHTLDHPPKKKSGNDDEPTYLTGNHQRHGQNGLPGRKKGCFTRAKRDRRRLGDPRQRVSRRGARGSGERGIAIDYPRELVRGR